MNIYKQLHEFNCLDFLSILFFHILYLQITLKLTLRGRQKVQKINLGM